MGYGAVIGIDLGTIYTRVGFCKDKLVEIIPNDLGHRCTPSLVSFINGQVLVGDAAKDACIKPSNTVFDCKRLIGHRFEDLDVEKELKKWPFLVTDQHGWPVIEIEQKGEKKTFAPEDISAMLLQKMKESAEAYLAEKVTHAIITVPPYFNDNQRQATKDAGKIAGLDIIRVINEPTAAAIANGLNEKQSSDECYVLIYDLGGGAFDATLLLVEDGIFELLATAGDPNLGGQDFDDRIRDHMAERYKNKIGTDISKDPHALKKLKREAEKVKHTLSSQLFTQLEIESLENGNNFFETLTRAEFEEINKDLFQRTMILVEQVLKDSRKSAKEIDDVVLVGGSSHIPKVRSLLKDLFNGKEPLAGINPDEAVAWGAALQGTAFSNDEHVQDLLIFQVCPVAIGVETTGGIFTEIIPSYSTVPVSRTRMFLAEAFSPAAAEKGSVTIPIYERARGSTDSNRLGELTLNDILPGPNGNPEIEVSIDITPDFLIWAKAVDKGSSKSEVVQVLLSNDLTT